MGEQEAAAGMCSNFWCSLVYLYEHGGIGVLSFFGLAFLFYKLIWKVWKAMIKSKDDEIERLIGERNFYQQMLFPDRLTSDAPKRIRDESSNAEVDTH